jgi:hypothetical protein
MKNKNRFSYRIAKKSVFQLKYMISHPEDFVPEAIEAAKNEIKKRETDGTIDADLKLMQSLSEGEGAYHDFISNIKTKSVVNLIPKFSEEFTTSIKYKQIYEQAAQVCEKLNWDVVFYDHSLIEAKRKKQFAGWAETIRIDIKNTGVVKVSCIYHDFFYDFGKCSKWVKLFIHVFQQMEEEFL